MGTLRIKRLSTTMLAAASLTAGAAAPAAVAAQNRPNITGIGFGSGSTAAAAHAAAADSLVGNFFACTPPRGNLVYDTQGPNGIWSAEVTATCQGAR